MASGGTITVTGSFEVHFTLRSPDGLEMDLSMARVAAIATEFQMKVTHVVLSHGDHASQLMLTRHGKGALETVMAEATRISAGLEEKGLMVQRVKIETESSNPAAPVDSREAGAGPAGWHFENHVKLLLPGADEAQLGPVRELAARHGARVSRNALRRRTDGQEERFLTQRIYRGGRDTAAAALEALLRDLAHLGQTVLETEAEYVVHDSNAALDSGWLDVESHKELTQAQA